MLMGKYQISNITVKKILKIKNEKKAFIWIKNKCWNKTIVLPLIKIIKALNSFTLQKNLKSFLVKSFEFKMLQMKCILVFRKIV